VASTGAKHRLPLTAVVLAGGRSLRMGVDKTQLDIGGRTLVARAVSAVAAVASEVIVVTNRSEKLCRAQFPASAEIMTDDVAYQGPLGGLATALKAARYPWVLAVAADMPWISADAVRLLWERRPGADVVIPVGEKGAEPLLALYRTATVGPVSAAVLASGRRRFSAMFPDLRVCEVPEADLRQVDPQLATLVNINTRDDYERAVELARATGHERCRSAAATRAPAGCVRPASIRHSSL